MDKVKELVEGNDYEVFVVVKNDRYTMFSIYVPVIVNGKVDLIPIVLESNNYYSKTKRCYWNTGYGSDRVFDIIYSISYDLFSDGYKMSYKML